MDRYLRSIQAGMVDIPGGLYEAIQNWISDVWGLVQKTIEANRTATKSKRLKVTRAMIEDWRYTKSLETRFPEVLKKAFPRELSVVLKINGKGTQAGHMLGTSELQIAIAPHDDWASVCEVVAHELTHWGQNFMNGILSEALHKDVRTGLPSGHLRDEGVKQDRHEKGYAERQMLHKLDDKEFYPLLRSSVETYASLFDNVIDFAEKYWENPTSAPAAYASAVRRSRTMFPHLDALLRYYTGVDDHSPEVPLDVRRLFDRGTGIFDLVREHNPGKWRKAVGIFFAKMAPYLKEQTWAKALGDPAVKV